MTDDLSLELLDSLASLPQEDRELFELKNLVAGKSGAATDLKRTLALIEALEEKRKFGGLANWFTGENSVANLPKHRTFFEATKDYNEVLFMAGNRVGKALRNGSKVLTPKGWVAIELLKVGDEVIDGLGNPCYVTGVFPQGKRPTYEVLFDDGAKVVADGEHLWKAQYGKERYSSPQKWKTYTTKNLLDKGVGTHPQLGCNIPVVGSYMQSQKTYIDPYVLGLMLGDGCMAPSISEAHFTTADKELVDYIQEKYVVTKRQGEYEYAINGMVTLLKREGLWGKLSYSKYIPKEYLFNSAPNRLALLRGLMDTDGTSGSQAEFYSTSEQLIDDVVFLVRSLGGKAYKSSKSSFFYVNGEKRYGRPSWRVRIIMADCPFRLSRKVASWKAPQNRIVRRIKTITANGNHECTCISVSSPDKTFITDDFVVTHNTIAGAYAVTCWATGEYPDWWPGRRFEHPVNIWVVGKDARATRDTLQKELLGSVGEWGTGMIPAKNIGKYFALQGTPQAIDIVKIKSAYGGWSEIGFKNYQQDIGSFMGTARHVVWGDEEMPILIYNECNIRTATTDGTMLLTFTPLDGLTPMVVNFCKKATYLVGAKPIVAMDQEDSNKVQGEQTVGATSTKAVIQAGWDDVPWLDAKTKARLLEDTPVHLREARSKGLPSQSSGNVYQTPLEQVLVDPFDIPVSWPRMYALDVGWNTTAAVWGALDPATDTLYFYHEHYMGKELPAVHGYAIRSVGDWIPGVIDPAAHGRSATDGRKLIYIYKDMGLNLREANNEVESGVTGLGQRFATGRAKIFKTCINIQKEYQLYRRNKDGKIIKENDHAMDCFDKDTEVLTNEGWKLWPAVTGEESFATVNLATDTLEYQRASVLVEKEYNGPMVFLDNKAQQLVTPNHRMVVYQRNDNYTTPVIREAQDLKLWDKIKLSCSNWKGSSFELPFEGCSAEDFAEVLGWWVAEGSLLHPYDCNKYRKGVTISQVKEDRKEELRELLDRMPQAWNYVGSSFQCTNKAFYDYLKPLGLSGNKYVPQEIKNASKNVIEAFLRGYFAGDGWLQSNGAQASASISKQLTDDIQELMFKVGRPGNVLVRKAKAYTIRGRFGTNTKDQYWFIESKVKTAMLRDSRNTSNVYEQHYEGKVYCATVPNGTLVVRRNGKLSVSGNCARYVHNNMKFMSSKAEQTNFKEANYVPTVYDC